MWWWVCKKTDNGGEAVILFGFVKEKNLMGSLVKIYVCLADLVWVWLGVHTKREERGKRENRG